MQTLKPIMGAVVIAVMAGTALLPTEARTQEKEGKPKSEAKQAVRTENAKKETKEQGRSTKWTKSTYDLHAKMVSMGVESKLAKHMIDGCKKQTDDAKKCVKTAVAIYGNESSFGKRCLNNSCFGFVGHSFKSKEDAFDRWLKSYSKHWWNHDGATFFYGGKGWVGKSRYCTSEVSSGTSKGCPNGAKIFAVFYKKL